MQSKKEKWQSWMKKIIEAYGAVEKNKCLALLFDLQKNTCCQIIFKSQLLEVEL